MEFWKANTLSLKWKFNGIFKFILSRLRYIKSKRVKTI